MMVLRVVLAAIAVFGLAGCMVTLRPVTTPGMVETVSLSPVPSSDPSADFLQALRDAGVQVSATGEAEIRMADGICAELGKGTEHPDMVSTLAAKGTMTLLQAEAAVTAAETFYC